MILTTKANTPYANLDFQFTKGIFQATANGAQIAFWADFRAMWRLKGDTVWTAVPVDWYYGAAQRAYVTPPIAPIQYRLPWGTPPFHTPDYSWHNYDPATSPAEMRQMTQDWKAGNQGYLSTSEYLRSQINQWVEFQYPQGEINEADYFGRYPDIRAAGWTRGATDHFESIGSREGRSPGVQTYVQCYNIWGGYWNASTMPSMLHAFDKQSFPTLPTVGGWGWIDKGQPVPTYPPPPFEWQITSPDGFDEATYLRRYPDVAYAVSVGQYASGWAHFTATGSFEGRDPYLMIQGKDVRLTQCYVGPYWMRIFLQFPAPGTYEISIMRTDQIWDGADTSVINAQGATVTARYNESVVMLLRSYAWGLPVVQRLRHTMLEMRVTATDQLNGVVQNLSAIAISVLPVTNDGANFWLAETRNPAWIAIDILCSEKNPRPLSYAQLDWTSWIHLAAVSDTLRSYVVNGLPYTGPRYTCDIVVDSLMTVKDLLESVLTSCRASLTLTSAGKWGVLLDEEKATPRQLITPANSWGFSGVRTFTQYPHALRVNFINRDNGWAKDEVVVYWDGYDANNATVFETLDTFGISDYAHAWAYGRYMLAQGIERSELFTLTMDVENLLVQRGDLVYVAHDVPRVGGVPARVVQVREQAVQIDRPLSAPPSGYAVRLSDGTTRTGNTATDENWQDQWFVLDNITGIQPDDLIVLGDYSRQTQPYLVQRIGPGADFSAELTLCKYAPGVYTADQGALPPWDPGFGHDFLNGTDLVSSNLTITQTMYYVNREPLVDVVLRWMTTGWQLDHHELTVVLPSGQRVALASPVPVNFTWTVDALRDRQYFDIALQFEVVPLSKVGARGQAAYASIVLLRDTTPPRPVVQFGVNVQKENVDLFWQPADDPDIAYYMIRYTPQVEYPDWNASQMLVTVQWPGNKSSAGARTGSYGIRAVDTSGNVSDVVWRRTTVAVLPEINVITILNDRDLYPDRWPGQKSHMVVAGAEVMSEGDFGAVYPDGIYFCSYPVDLGDVYEVRVTSKIEAYGVTSGDYMSSWVTLAQVDAMAHSNTALWDAWLEVRVADEMKVMADWIPSISTVDPLADGADSSWSAWRPCQVGDFTAQILQFRICVQSKNPGVRVVVSSGRIEVDMPDRIDTYGDVQVSAAGLDFVYPVAFRKVEAIAVTIDGNPDPVVAVVTNKTAEGFHLVLRNTITSALTAGQVDIMAEGYGRKRLTSI